jgi:hypothetical protein
MSEDASGGSSANQQPATVGNVAQEIVAPGRVESSSERDQFDPLGWRVPVVCKDCNKSFEVPYRHFQAGVVFHCVHCHGSFVPNYEMYRAVREAFENFYSSRKLEHAEFAKGGIDEGEFRRTQDEKLENFRRELEALAHDMRPAGKLVRRRGLAAMFT